MLASPAASAVGPGKDRADMVSAGRDIFVGDTPVQGIITGHSQPLPAEAVACANCHTGIRPQASARPFGAVALTRSELTEARKRRGGPASQFSQASFCRLLRTGVDPVSILISRKMPRYILTDEQCESLWEFLMDGGDNADD